MLSLYSNAFALIVGLSKWLVQSGVPSLLYTREHQLDVTYAHIGKKNSISREKTSKNILDDKSATEQFKPLYNLYGSVETEGSLYDKVVDQAPLYGDYDDEYDDTYDTNLIGADDADSADELSVRRYVVYRMCPSTSVHITCTILQLVLQQWKNIPNT